MFPKIKSGTEPIISARWSTIFMKNWKAQAILMLIICTSCKFKMSSKDFKARENAFFAAYCTNDIKGAEQALLDGLRAIDAL
jgi:hypothetical protein